MRIDEALKSATQALADFSDSPRLDSDILLSHFLGKPRSYLYAWPESTLDLSTLTQFKEAIRLRKTAYPVAYITGHQEFWSLDIGVTPDVLIPRADTELLVEASLDRLQSIHSPKILDLGTGSGAIALALASERADAQIMATDASAKSLAVAERNQQQLHIPNIQFVESDWYNAIPAQQFDLIVSNPPYIDPRDPHMTTGIRHEPIDALCAENKGLADITQIIHGASKYLTSSAWLLLEHGYDQGAHVTDALREHGFDQIACLKDLAGHDRVSLGQYTC